MDFRWLQDFLSLAEAGNFTSAAEARHSSQSAFSRRIQSLESWLGVELIDRSRYPTALTPAGEIFRQHAADLLKKMMDSRAELQGEPVGDHQTITFALPHTLAISSFPQWWDAWREGVGGSSCRLLASNVHDAVTALVSGLADVLICYHHAQQPVFLDPVQYEKIVLGTEWLRPYAGVRPKARLFTLPGTVKSPAPLLSYSSGAFLARMVDIILDSVPDVLHAATKCESDMANVLLEMAIAGHGVAWLPEHTAAPAVQARQLVRVGDDRWTLPLTICLYFDRLHKTPDVDRLTQYLADL
ncbi:MAG: LysR family transcriptional regulator [Rhodospirillaceae bacterium]|nr:LysR family transcriptional regulator [Rhodospirillaceae bacterium]